MMRIYRKLLSLWGEPASKKPTQALLETTNRCNLNCPYCMQGQATKLVDEHGHAAHELMKRPMGILREEQFEIIRKRLKRFGVRKVYLHFHGEPMLNKHTPRYAAILKEDGFWVGIFTNGQALIDGDIQALARSGIDLIRFSVDGASEETYQANRVGGTFTNVFNNMKKSAEACRGGRTRVEWQFIALRNNEHEIGAARELAGGIGVRFFVKGFRETNPALAPLDPALRSTRHAKPCLDIYKQLGIYWNGDVVPCCYDIDASEIMGNVLEDDLDTIWDNAKYRQFRARVAAVRTDPDNEPELCRDCLRWS